MRHQPFQYLHKEGLKVGLRVGAGVGIEVDIDMEVGVQLAVMEPMNRKEGEMIVGLVIRLKSLFNGCKTKKTLSIQLDQMNLHSNL